MPIKLIGTIILLILVTIFAGVNLDNKCDITFIFYTFKDVPVFMTVIISFAIGLIVMLPFTFGRKRRKAVKQEAKPVENKETPTKTETESKTLFDFKIKREGNAENGKLKEENGKAKKEKKSLFGLGKKAKKGKNSTDDAQTPESETNPSSTSPAEDESSGAPV